MALDGVFRDFHCGVDMHNSSLFGLLVLVFVFFFLSFLVPLRQNVIL